MMTQQKAYRHLKKAWVVISCLCLISLPVNAFADDNIQRMTYDVYASGFHVVQADLVMDYSKPGRYSLELTAKTRGFLGRLAPWEGTFESHGWIVDDHDLRPELHRSTTTWRDEEEIKSYNYKRDGSFKSLVIKEHEKPEETKDIEPVLTDGSTDSFTAALMILHKVFDGEQCVGASKVFDGKRSFEQIFDFEKEEYLKTSRYNIYEGPSQKCTVEVKPLEGKWHKKPRGWLSIQEQGRERGTMPTVWIGNLNEYGPAVPVKIFVKTAYGALFMHLAEYQSGEDRFVSDKRK